MQQPHAGDGVELPVAEGESAAVADDDGAGQPDGGPARHRVGEVETRDPHPVPRGREPTGHDPGAAGDVEQSAGALGDEAQHGAGRGLGPGLTAAQGVVVAGPLVVVQHPPQLAPWPGASASTLRASSKSFSVTAPPALCVLMVSDTVL